MMRKMLIRIGSSRYFSASSALRCEGGRSMSSISALVVTVASWLRWESALERMMKLMTRKAAWKTR